MNFTSREKKEVLFFKYSANHKFNCGEWYKHVLPGESLFNPFTWKKNAVETYWFCVL